MKAPVILSFDTVRNGAVEKQNNQNDHFVKKPINQM
jgi:hypothetical protein